MLRSVDLKDYMLHDPVKVRGDDDVFKAIQLILIHKISGVCVVDDDDQLAGVLSEMDCLDAILSAVYNEAMYAGPVKQFMTTDVDTVRESDNIVDVASDMLKQKQRRRPVIDDEGRLVGQVSCRQILRAVREFSGTVDTPED